MDLGIESVTKHLEKLSKLPKAYRMAILPVLAAAVAGAYVYFLFLPSRQQVAEIRSQQLELQRKLNEVRSVTENLERFQQEIAELEKRLQVALRQLPNSKELPVLLTDVSTLGKNAGLDIQVFRPRDEVHRDFYAEVPIEIEFSGRFHDIASFFDEVSRLPRIVNVGQLDVSIGDESSTDTTLKVKGEALTFRFLENPSVGTPTPVAANAAPPARRP